ncbi:hypothetical protein LZ31DRAFT_184559 [Colletotrichum somersetense]|nr:hypothetical protein LZ31DRAFT_184559 [Colletotrichum somersetense]
MFLLGLVLPVDAVISPVLSFLRHWRVQQPPPWPLSHLTRFSLSSGPCLREVKRVHPCPPVPDNSGLISPRETLLPS